MAIKTADAIKSDEGNDALDNFIRQAMGKESFLSYPKTNDSPVQWIQLLHALDQHQDLPGWPLLTPVKIQMQKCDKCSKEFCSTINYRRHMRLHRRKLNLDKDSNTKNRVLLQAFWDKVSVEEAMEITSFDDVSLEGVAGSSIIKALASFIRKPGFTSLPYIYVKSGSALLDIVQGRPLKFPVSSEELFSILDEASENTFLRAGTAESLQKYVFDGEAAKIGLEMRNLVACTSFLVERKLVKACLADKDAESLRYQKLLMEEEEAAQKRQAALLEKKRLKKLRLKLQRAKELPSTEYDDNLEECSSSPSTSSPADAPDSTLEMPEIFQDATASSELAEVVNVDGNTDKDHGNRYQDSGAYPNGYLDLGARQNSEYRASHRSGRRHTANSRGQAPKLQKIPNGFHTSHNYQAAKSGSIQKHTSSRDSRAAAPNAIKVWTPKPRSETDEGSPKTRLLIEAPNPPVQDKKHEVLIGSIPIALVDHNAREQYGNVGAREKCASEQPVPGENGTCERSSRSEGNQGVTNRSTVKLWRPVSRYENGGQQPVQNSSHAEEVGGSFAAAQKTCLVDNISNECEKNSESSVECGQQGGLKFSRHAAEAFLSNRWKEAMLSDHVKLVLFPEGPAGHSEMKDDNHEALLSSKLNQSGVLCGTVQTVADTPATVKPKVKSKPEKGGKVKYIPKERSGR